MFKKAYDAMRDALLAVEGYLATDVDGDRPTAKEHLDLVRAALDLADPSKTTPFSPIYKRLPSALTAMKNCSRAGNTEWLERWSDSIDAMMRHAPSGGGFDSGTTLDRDKTTDHKLVFDTAYHHMSEHGYYNGWTEHTVTVTPDFGGFDMKISGRDRNEIKDYIADCFDTFLTTESND